MIEIGNKIECYRGEAFEIHRSFVNKDGAPLYIEQGTLNPYLKVSVRSNTYSFAGEYRKNYWLDLSDFTQYKGYKQFKNNSLPQETIAMNLIDDVSVITESLNFPDLQAYIEQDTEFGNVVSLSSSSNFDTAQIRSLKIACNNISGMIRIKLINGVPQSNVRIVKVCITSANNLPSDDQYIQYTDLVDGNVFANIAESTNELYVWFITERIAPAVPGVRGFALWLSNIYYADDFDGSYIGYIITNTGREYYSKIAAFEYVPYSFNIAKAFLHNDTKDWISGIYKYDITICSGQLMTDWLTRNFISLYPDAVPPKSNAELAHYICKKDNSLLRNVDITEPLVSYNIYAVLLEPNKLIVKEA